QSPLRPEDIATHCSMVSKLQPTIPAVTSLRQYSPSEAGVAKLTKARAHSAGAGAANFKNVFMLLSLGSLLSRAVFQPLFGDMGAPQMLRYARMAVPLANPLLACVNLRFYVRSFSLKRLAIENCTGPGVGGSERKESSPPRRVSIGNRSAI